MEDLINEMKWNETHTHFLQGGHSSKHHDLEMQIHKQHSITSISSETRTSETDY